VPVKGRPGQADVHMEDVHRAGGIMSILGELDRAGLLHTHLPTVHSRTMGDALNAVGYQPHQRSRCAEILQGAPGGVPTQTAFSQSRRWDELDLDREGGVIRSKEHAFSQDGGLAVLFGNIARDGCIVKTAGVDDSILKFAGPAKVYESQDAAVTAILTGQVVEGDVVVIRYEGPERAGRGCRKCSTRPAI
jgi:dihydroxy-acid dehydratase